MDGYIEWLDRLMNKSIVSRYRERKVRQIDREIGMQIDRQIEIEREIERERKLDRQIDS